MRNQKMKRDAIHGVGRKAVQTDDTRAVKRKAIDDAFRGMADDKLYQCEALLIAEQFAASDAEAMELCERDSVRA